MKAKRILASVLSVALLLQLSPLGVLALDEGLPQTPQVSTVQENLDPAPTEEPALVAEPAPTEEPTPTAAPTPEPTAEPTVTPTAEPAPDAAETPAPEPSAEPTAAPDPTAEVQALIDALPDEVTEDNAEAVEQALTDIDDAKESLTDEELAGLDLTRYDAAANALLALLGEAPTDAVELLDNYTEPAQAGGYYQIATVNDLYWLATSAPMNVKAKLTADIKLNGENKVLNDDGSLTSNADTLVKWTPIGTKTKSFKGTFDGKGYTISGLYINDSSKNHVGLFGYVGENGTVKDVTLKDSYVSGNECVGGICGYNKGGTLQNCHNAGTVSGAQSVGGVCGENRNSGIIQKCDNAGTVSGTGESIGGVCGVNVANLNSTPTIQECYNTGKVSSTWFRVGGVCGNNNGGTVKKSYNTGTVSGEDTVGGVCGRNEKSSSYSATVNGCYNTGTVSGANAVGGVCGYNGNSDTMINCYYLAGTSANAVGRGNEGTNCVSKTELQFQNGDVAYQLQSDLNITTQVWGQRIDKDKTPVLSSDPTYAVHPAAPGSICKRYSNTPDQTFTEHVYDDKTRICSRCGESKPLEAVNGYYEIYNQDQLREFADQVNKGAPGMNARLMNNITMDGTEWTPIGTDTISFKGTFDGQGYTISKLTCTDTNKDHVGLVGYAIDATIQNVTVQGATLNGRDYIGAVCGYLTGGTITNCHAVETVIGKTGREAQSKYRGGIVGNIIGNTNVTGCTNSGTVSGLNFLGGIVGQAKQATVQRCFNSGAVTGNASPIGGIVGFANNATVQDCGNTGAVTSPNGNAYCGGIAGSTNSTSSIQNCYNAYRTIVHPICASPSQETTLLNCYYLADNPGTDPSAKTEAQFNSGEVAYLLQNGERTDTTTTVWGQTLTEPNKQNYPVLGGDKVYRSTPCPTDYTNTAQQTLDHSYTTGGVCSRCGEWQEAKQAADGYYEIHNQGQLRWFAEKVNSGNYNINARLMDDIKLNGDNKVLNDDGSLISDTSNLKSWTPIGKSGNSFKGEFDGNGHTIRGLYFNDTNKGDVGLFGFVGAGGTVKNVTLADSYVSGSWYVGGICGQNYGGTVEGCRNTGRVYGTRHYVGGVCGHNEGILQKSCNTGIVTGYEYVGGVCGFNVSNSGSQSTIQECYNTGSVSGTGNYTGGVCGYNSRGSTLEKSYNTGTVSGENIVGGVCGYNDRTVNGCYNIGGVTSTSGRNVGGVCGKNEDGGTVSNCYYLDTIANAIGTGDGINCESKTEAAFKNGEVAYLLQKVINDAATEGTPAEQVWGQKIGEDNYPKLGGDKVYQTTPCTAGYSNTDGTYKAHTPGTDGKCIDCKQLCISYTVTIPATVELGNAANATATISAENVTLPTDKTLQVIINGPFTATLVGKTDVTAQYTIQKDGTALTDGSTVLTAQNGEFPKIPLTFVKPDAAPYAGSYTDTVTFTVSVN